MVVKTSLEVYEFFFLKGSCLNENLLSKYECVPEYMFCLRCIPLLVNKPSQCHNSAFK